MLTIVATEEPKNIEYGKKTKQKKEIASREYSIQKYRHLKKMR